MEKLCSICNKSVDSEAAAILTIGGFGNPKYICEECDGDFADATGAKDIIEISAAMDRISKKMTSIGADDKLVLKSVKEIMEEAYLRAEKIKNGTYDFSIEENNRESGDDSVPEELRETEEDKELDRKESERNKKLDKITNWVCIGVLIALLGFIAYRVITTFI